jgi:L-arabonate dehydrase
MAQEGLRPSRILTREAFENTIRMLEAIGGSTNAIIHLIALAGRVGVPLSLDDFDAAADTPVLVNVEPSGTYLMDDFYYAGGVQAVINEVLPLLHEDAVTVNGRTIGENAKGAHSSNEDVIRPLSNPLSKRSAHVILRGTLAPDGAVLKRSAASPRLLQHTGPAIVFEDVFDLAARIDDPSLEVDENSVLILKNGGPKGAPGFPEFGTLPLPEKLMRRGVTDMLRISDSRISGTTFGTIVCHVAPEAAVGGPIGLVETGDTIRLDVQQGAIDLDVEPAELQRRSATRTPYKPQYKRGYGALYLANILQAPDGADFDFLRNLDGEPAELVPLLLMHGWVSI